MLCSLQDKATGSEQDRKVAADRFAEIGMGALVRDA